MELHDVERLVDHKVGASLRSHKEDMLKEIGNMFEKISGNTNLVQLNKLSCMVHGGEKFKSKSNEEQFKYNSSVSFKLDEAEHSMSQERHQEGREKIAEG